MFLNILVVFKSGALVLNFFFFSQEAANSSSTFHKQFVPHVIPVLDVPPLCIVILFIHSLSVHTEDVKAEGS